MAERTTATPLAFKEPFLIVRTVPLAVLKYNVDRTGFTRPEGVIAISSQGQPKGVAVRDVIESTGTPSPFIE
jgi:hypothetical protein